MASEADFQALHLLELGGVMAGAPAQDVNTAALVTALGAYMPAVWTVARTRVRANGTLPLVAKREAIEVLLGQLRTKRDGSLGPLQLRNKALFDNLMALWKQTQDELVRQEVLAARGYRPAVGEILRRAPQEVTTPTATVTDRDGVHVADRDFRVPLTADPNNLGYPGHPLLRPGQLNPYLPP